MAEGGEGKKVQVKEISSIRRASFLEEGTCEWTLKGSRFYSGTSRPWGRGHFLECRK